MTLPNIVLLVSDDQPKGMLDAMPFVTTEIKQRGVTFGHGLAPTALCCPSRSSLLSGNFSRTHGVYTNEENNYGGWTAFQNSEANTVATKLQAKGYHTALVGKYLNGFKRAPDGYTPPGWNDFITTKNGYYYDYTLYGTVPTEVHGSLEEDYSTDVLREHAKTVIQYAPGNKPLFLMFTPFGPHPLFTPAPRHEGTWHPETTKVGFNEAQMGDKPTFMQALPLLDEEKWKQNIQKQHEALMSVDEAFQAIYNQMIARGYSVDNTLFIFVSDNGYMDGVHRWTAKDLAYQGASEINMIFRWTANAGLIGINLINNRTTPTVDITGTIAEAAGITNWNIDGRSAFSTGRSGVVLEQTNNPETGHPAYVGYRTRDALYIEYSSGQGKELYDYTTDPNELHSVHADPAYATLMQTLRDNAIAECHPVPPGFTWSNN